MHDVRSMTRFPFVDHFQFRFKNRNSYLHFSSSASCSKVSSCVQTKPELSISVKTSSQSEARTFPYAQTTWLVASGGRFLMRIFLLLLSSCRVLANLRSISSGSRSGRSRRLIPESEGCAAAASSSSGCRLSGLSIGGESAHSPAREE